MAISYVSSATGTNSIASMPTHQAGDLLLFFAFAESEAAPSLASGYTSALTYTDTAGNDSCRVGWKIAASGSETSGTWTNAVSLICHVYRGTHQTAPIGGTQGYSFTDAGLTTTVNYRTITMSDSSGASWVVGFAGDKATNSTLETPPTGMTNRSNALDATAEAAGHDTNGGVSSWSTQTVAVGGSASGWVSAVVELLDASVTVTVTGESATCSIGSVTVTGGASVAAIKRTMTSSIGSVTVVGTGLVTLTGEEATSAINSVTVQLLTAVPVTGEAATSAIESVTVTGGATVLALKRTMTSSVGDVTVLAGIIPPVTGASATGEAGDVTVATSAVVSVVGEAATGALGDVTIQLVTIIPVTGEAATGATGTVMVTGVGLVLAAGSAATGAVGDVTIYLPTVVYATGVFATGYTGAVFINTGWVIIDNTQTASWQPIDTVQDVGWQDTVNTQSANWMDT